MKDIFSHQLRRPAVWALLVFFAAVLLSSKGCINAMLRV